MRFSRRLTAVVVLSLLVIVVPKPTIAKDKWIKLTTKNFDLVSNAGEDDTRKLALKLEQFHSLFSKIFGATAAVNVATTVVVFKNDDSFKPFKPLYNGKPANVGGFFQRADDQNTIALNISAPQEHPLGLILHEYTHLRTGYAQRRWPAWLQEGIAEVYSTFDVNKNKVTVGAPVSHHVFLLREKKFIPLKTLFNIDHKSPEYNERNKQGTFYAQSWALVHYLMLGNNGARNPQFVDFVKRFNAGAGVEEAFAATFKTDLTVIEKELRQYVGNDSYSAMVYTLDNTEGDKDVTIRPLSDAEVQSHLGNLLMRTDRPEEAETYFNQAIAGDANLAQPYEGLGLIAVRRDKFDEAVEHFEKAVQRDSKNHLAHYYYADALMRRARNGITPELAAKINDSLTNCTKLRPRFAHSYYLLGTLALLTSQNIEQGVQALKTAMTLEPQKRYFRLSLAQLLMRKQDYAEARKTLEPLLSTDVEHEFKNSAQSLMTIIDSYERSSPRLSKVTDGGDTGAEQADAGRAATSPAGRSKSYPTLKIEGAEVVHGVLVSIECEQARWFLVVRVQDKLIRFIVTDVLKLEFFNQDPDFKTEISCGPVNHPAFIYSKKLPAGQSSFAGDAVAVEFTK